MSLKIIFGDLFLSIEVGMVNDTQNGVILTIGEERAPDRVFKIDQMKASSIALNIELCARKAQKLNGWTEREIEMGFPIDHKLKPFDMTEAELKERLGL